MKNFISCFFTITVLVSASNAYAGSTTITVLDGNAAPQKYDVTTDGAGAAGNFIARSVICDQGAATNCAAVSVGNALSVGGTVTSLLSGTATALQGGSWTTTVLGSVTVNNITGGTVTALLSGTSTALQGGSWTVTSLLSGTSTALQGGAWTATVNNITGGTLTVLQGGAWSNTVTNTNANGQAAMASSSPVAIASDQKVADPCTFQAKSNAAINYATTTSLQVVALSATTTVYVCSLSLIASTATAMSMFYGTGTACATAPTAVIGGVTATTAVGLSFSANGGLTLGNGGNTVALGAAGKEICIIQSGSGVLAGNLTYVQQ